MVINYFYNKLISTVIKYFMYYLYFFHFGTIYDRMNAQDILWEDSPSIDLDTEQLLTEEFWFHLKHFFDNFFKYMVYFGNLNAHLMYYEGTSLKCIRGNISSCLEIIQIILDYFLLFSMYVMEKEITIMNLCFKSKIQI